jgi:hypothetical protein
MQPTQKAARLICSVRRSVIKGEMMTHQRLKVASLFAFTSALLQIIISFVSTGFMQEASVALRIVTVVPTVTSLVLFVYIWITLKALLGSRYGFHDVDRLILALVILKAVFVASIGLLIFYPSLLNPAASDFTVPIMLIMLPACVLFGIVLITFGIKLRRLKGDLFGMLKPISNLSIATGVCFAIVLLIPIGILTSVLSDIFLGIVFYKTWRDSTLVTA